MKTVNQFVRSARFYACLSFVLAFLMIFGLCPNVFGQALAQIDLQWPSGSVNDPTVSIVVSPQTAIIDIGESQTFTATAYDAKGNGSDVTLDTVFSVPPEAGGYWEGGTYTSDSPAPGA